MSLWRPGKPLSMQNTRVRPCKCCQHLHLRTDNSRNIVVSENNRFCLRDVIEGFDMSMVRVWNETKSGTLLEILIGACVFTRFKKKNIRAGQTVLL